MHAALRLAGVAYAFWYTTHTSPANAKLPGLPGACGHPPSTVSSRLRWGLGDPGLKSKGGAPRPSGGPAFLLLPKEKVFAAGETFGSAERRAVCRIAGPHTGAPPPGRPLKWERRHCAVAFALQNGAREQRSTEGRRAPVHNSSRLITDARRR